jgi:hypothetical protein
LNRLLRDHRTGEQYPIDPALFDILHDLRVATGTASPFQVISGYRSASTNGMLRERSTGVASGSLHLQGRAVDVRLADVSSAALRDAAIRLRRAAWATTRPAISCTSTRADSGPGSGPALPALGPGAALLPRELGNERQVVRCL